MVTDSGGNLYFTESSGRVRKLTESLLVTLARELNPWNIPDFSFAALAGLAQPVGVAVNSAGALVISDTWNDCMRPCIVARLDYHHWRPSIRHGTDKRSGAAFNLIFFLARRTGSRRVRQSVCR